MAFLQRILIRARGFFSQSHIFTPSSSISTSWAPVFLGGTSAIGSNNPLTEALWMAAPKSKVTPSRKKIRNNAPTKRLKNIVHFQVCELCGEKKLRHRLCMSCFKQGKYFQS